MSLAPSILYTDDLAHAMRESFAVSPRVLRSDWVAEHIRLSPQRSPFPGPFSFETHAYAREPIDALDNEDVRQIVLLWATQLGKGDTTLAALWSQAELSPSPCLFIGPDQNYVREQRDRFFAMGESSPRLRALVPPKHARNLSAIDLATMRIYLGWSGSAQTVSGRSVLLVVYSEADQSQSIVGQAPPTRLAEERVKAWYDIGAKIIWEGTPTHESSFMASKYEASDRREFHLPCPHCGKMQVLRHYPIKAGQRAGRGGISCIRDEHGNPLPADEARESARYVCLDGCTWSNSDRLAALPHGVWLPKGVRLSRSEPKECQQVRTVNGREYFSVGEPESKTTSIRGYHLNSLYAWSLSIGDNAVKMLESEEDAESRVNFVNNWKAEKRKIGRRRMKADEFAIAHEGDYLRGNVPEQAAFLTMAADVQASQIFWVTRAWASHRTSFLIDWGSIGEYQSGMEDEEIGDKISENLKRLAIVAQKRYPIDCSSDAQPRYMPIGILGIDSNYHPHPVLEACAYLFDGLAVPLIGQNYMNSGKSYWPESVLTDWKGRPIGALKRYRVCVDVYKDDLANHLWPLSRGESGAWHLPADVRESGVSYLQQILNEEEVVELVKRSNRRKTRWKVITPAYGNHYWDCEIYNRALADIVTNRNWDFEPQEMQVQEVEQPNFSAR